MQRLEQLLAKVQEAAEVGINSMSSGEALAAALVLNRTDWLAAMDYTIPEALSKIDQDWVFLIPQAARLFKASEAYINDAKVSAKEQMKLAKLGSGENTIDVIGSLVTWSNAPGYRDIRLTFDVQRHGAPEKTRLGISINPEDGEKIVSQILDVHRWAWRNGKPIDQREGELRPSWIDKP